MFFMNKITLITSRLGFLAVLGLALSVTLVACSPQAGGPDPSEVPDARVDIAADGQMITTHSNQSTSITDNPQDITMASNENITTTGNRADAVFAGGCFWCTEAVFEPLAGVYEVVSGYAGGTADTANYQAVSNKLTDHAEAIRISYDPSVITYGELLKIFFTVAHDPTQLNRQGNDVGKHYRSAIFYANDEEKQAAQAYIEQLTEAKVFDKPIVTTLEPLNAFYVAEAYHQDYAALNPNQPYIFYQALPKVEKLKEKFSDKLKVESQN